MAPQPIASVAPARGLTLAIILLAALTMLASLTMSFGLLSFAAIHNWRKTIVQVTRIEPAPPSPVVQLTANGSRERDLASIQQRLIETLRQTRELEESEQAARTSALPLREQESQLMSRVEQRRLALSDAEAKTRRSAEEQRRAAERMQLLRAQAADLERRIAELRASIEEARAARAAQSGSQNLAPQFVECVRGGVILQPQRVRIASTALGNGVLASSAHQRGVYFLVRPTGFESFITARGIARAAGTVVGYEPSRLATGER